MSDYQATYDALTNMLLDPEYKQLFYTAILDAQKDEQLSRYPAFVDALKEMVLREWCTSVGVDELG